MNKLIFCGLCTWIVFALGCATQATTEPDPGGTDEFASADADPWEPVNRVTFAFNDRLDAWLLKPSAQAYRFVTPEFVQTGISHFFDNLEEVPDTINYILQWKWKKAANDSGRFLINSTLGLAGFFDVAEAAGLAKADPESFGQTFSYWGIPQGPYLVIPFLGSSTVTDAAGIPFYWYAHPVEAVDDKETRLALTAISFLDRRAALLDAEDLIRGDKYVFIRDAYLQRRDYLVRDGEEDIDALEEFQEDFEGIDADF